MFKTYSTTKYFSFFLIIFLCHICNNNLYAAVVQTGDNWSLPPLLDPNDPSVQYFPASIEILSVSFEGGDPSALVTPFFVQDLCVRYDYDNSKSFIFDVEVLTTYDNEDQSIFTETYSDTSPEGEFGGPCPGYPIVLESVIAVDDSFEGTADQEISGNVTINDSGWGPDSVTVRVSQEPGSGALNLDPQTGQFTYVPNPGFSGTDTFTYFLEVADFGGSNIATVTLTVNAINRPPVAVDDTFGEDYAGKNVLANDTDPDGDSLTAILVSQPQNGTVTLNANGTFTYTPNDGVSGADSFTYRASDGQAESNVATVSITLTPVNSPPVAVNDPFGSDYAGKNVLANDTDPDGDSLTAILVSQPQNGTVTLNANGTFTYTPNDGASGADSFTYRASDGQAESNVATVSITVTPSNSPPVAVDDPFGSDYAGKNVLANDSDPDGDELIAIIVSDPKKGTLTLNPDGTFEYKPYSGETGEDSFTYKARDRAVDDPDGLDSNIATVTLGLDGNNIEGPITDKEDEDGFTVVDNVTPEQLDTSNQIDTMCPELAEGGTENDAQADLLTLCSNLAKQGTSARETVTALEAITPEEVASQRNMGRQSSLTQSKNIAARIAGIRRGAKGVSIAGLNLRHEGVVVPGNTLDAMLDEALDAIGGGASADEVNDLGNLGIFVRGDLAFGDKDETDRESGFDFDAQSLTFGVDYRFTDNLFLGVSGSIGTSEIDFDNNGGDVDADNYAFALYGSFYTQGAAYVDGIISYGWSDIDSKRNIVYEDFGGKVDRTAKSSTDGDQYYVSFNAGYTFNRGGWNLDPSIRFYYLDGNIDSYQEQGAGGWNLAFDDQDYESTTLSFSGQLGYTFTPAWGVLIPYARVEYTREFEDNAQGVLYNFVSDPFVADDGGGFLQIRGDDPDSNYMVYTAGTSAQFKYGLSAFVSYSLLGSYKDLSNETVSFGLRWETTF